MMCLRDTFFTRHQVVHNALCATGNCNYNYSEQREVALDVFNSFYQFQIPPQAVKYHREPTAVELLLRI